jgi:dihydrofolate reductase
MATVIYSMSVSLDGFIAGPNGEIDWAAPDEELMRFHNEQTRELGAHLCGRGLYEDMLPWEVAGETRSDPQQLEFARIWKAIPKVVFSTTLEKVEGKTSTGCSSVRSCWEAAPHTFQLWTRGPTSSWSRRGHSALASSTFAIGVSALT